MQPMTGVPVSKATGVPGWRHHPEEEKVIIAYANRYVEDGGVVIELGTEYGRGASELAYGCRGKRDVRIVSIDLFPNNHPEVGDLEKTWRDNINEVAHLFPFVELRQLKSDTAKAGFEAQLRDEPPVVHLLFVDGAHDAGGVARDLEAWAPLVKVGGAILIHDYWKGEHSHPLHRAVKQSVDAWYNPEVWGRIDLPGSLVAFERVGVPGAPTPPLPEAEAQQPLLDNNADAVEEEGRQAYRDGKGRASCPYEDNHVRDWDLLWNNGWLAESGLSNTAEVQQPLMSVPEIAKALGVSDAVARKAAKTVEPAGKRGRGNLYHMWEVRDAINVEGS